LSINLLHNLKQLMELLKKPVDIFSVDNSEVVLEKADLDCLQSEECDSHWLILRCSKCNQKSIPMIGAMGNVIPANKYCKSCGSENFYLEKKMHIDGFDTIYALYSNDLIEIKKAMVRHYKLGHFSDSTKPYVSQKSSDAWNDDSEFEFIEDLIDSEDVSKVG
jgi:hypothetical protein